jgi:3-phenylpropionate/trans-cinnamate dioxygenase ferredoxin reductase subunit
MSAETFGIIGGGVTAARAVEGMREAGHEGPIVLVTEEDRLPYEKPPLSKGVLIGNDPEETAFTHPKEWYDEQRVDLRLNTVATEIDPPGRTVTLGNGESLAWDKLLLATGSSVRRLDVEGGELPDVLYLRSMPDSAALKARLVAGSDVVIIGAGWIGLEVAAAARQHGCNVTVLEPQPTPLYGVMGPEIGGWFAALHESHGVVFRFGDGLDHFTGDNQVRAVVTSAGDSIPADTVVVGVGIRPNTELAEQAGLTVDNGVVCDEGLRTSADGVYAAGDVANWHNPTLETSLRVEHWANAHDGGFAAGQSMAGVETHYGPVPFFFSDQYDIGLEYAGYVPRGTDADVVLRGDPKSNEFMAFWLDGDRVLAGMHVNVWDTIDTVQDLVRQRTPVDRDRLADPSVPLTEVAAATAPEQEAPAQ